MSPADFDKLVDATIADIKKLIQVKGGEYAEDAERFENFIRNGKRLGLNRMTIWAVYFNKHVDAINSYIGGLEKGKIRESSEPIQGRFKDAIVYLLLGLGMVEEISASSSFDWKDYVDPKNNRGFPVLADGWYYNISEGDAWKPWPIPSYTPKVINGILDLSEFDTSFYADKIILEQVKTATLIKLHGIQYILNGEVFARFYVYDRNLISAASHKS